jgi:hypothetical protein
MPPAPAMPAADAYASVKVRAVRGRRRLVGGLPPSDSVNYFFLLFLFFFLFFLLFLATYITPLHDPAGQRSVDLVSTYH